tara:strand:+ start:37 stop:222 length:186 start_codon:yes stop_codon:yes gene_type:complete
VNNRKKLKLKGKILRYINGCLLPHFDLNLSDHAPIKGSVIASKTKATPRAKDASNGLNPRT